MINTVKKLNVDGVFSNSYLLTLENGNTLYVPKDEANTDYQAILQWVADGKYFFSASINTWGQNYNAYQVRTTYYINGSETTYLRGALLEVSSSQNDIANVKFANVVILNLSANDYVEVYSYSRNPDNSNTITIDSESTFMGYRIA